MQHAGWGRINPNINSLAPRLKQASAPVASHSECRRTNGGSVDESSMVCVGGKGSSVCNGDSGGVVYGGWSVGPPWSGLMGD